MKISRKQLVIAAVATLGVGWIGAQWWNRGEPIRVARAMRADIMNRNWDAVFDRAVAEERERNGWSREKFTTLAKGLTDHLSMSEVEGNFSETLPESQSGQKPQWNLATERHLLWTINQPSSLNRNADSVVEVMVVKDHDGSWRMLMGPVLRGLNRIDRKDTSESIRSLERALVSANLPRYYDLISDQVMTPAGLERVLRGEVESTKVWETPEN